MVRLYGNDEVASVPGRPLAIVANCVPSCILCLPQRPVVGTALLVDTVGALSGTERVRSLSKVGMKGASLWPITGVIVTAVADSRKRWLPSIVFSNAGILAVSVGIAVVLGYGTL